MGLLLITLLMGILLSPCLDERSVWIAIPGTIATLTLSQGFALAGSRFAPSSRGRAWCWMLLVELTGAVDASMLPAGAPIPEDTVVGVVGNFRKAHEWPGLG